MKRIYAIENLNKHYKSIMQNKIERFWQGVKAVFLAGAITYFIAHYLAYLSSLV